MTIGKPFNRNFADGGKTIKIFKAESMDYTPFASKESIEFLREQGILLSDRENDCDVFVSRFLHKLMLFRIKYPSKKYLIWTHEPRYNINFKNQTHSFIGLPDVHIMNAYTGNIYMNNYCRYGQGINCILDYLNENNFSNFKHKKIVVLVIYRNNKKKWSLSREGQEIDLCYLRTQIALEGYKLNKIDIYGKDWPNRISIENSRSKGWKERKKEILQDYYFNLCFENTNIDYYCSEKIWDSIKYGCLPIYYGKNNKIYETFPQNSFLDYCDFKYAKALFKYIENMDEKEFRQRMNFCIQVFNNIYLKRKNQKYYDSGKFDQQILLNIVGKLREIVSHTD